jgi:hypothetical protein
MALIRVAKTEPAESIFGLRLNNDEAIWAYQAGTGPLDADNATNTGVFRVYNYGAIK